jgi:hypothetical protein
MTLRSAWGRERDVGDARGARGRRAPAATPGSCAIIPAMRGFVWLVFASAACGSVGARSDAQTGDDGAVAAEPGTLRWVRSLSSLEALGIADGPGASWSPARSPRPRIWAAAR